MSKQSYFEPQRDSRPQIRTCLVFLAKIQSLMILVNFSLMRRV